MEAGIFIPVKYWLLLFIAPAVVALLQAVTFLYLWNRKEEERDLQVQIRNVCKVLDRKGCAARLDFDNVEPKALVLMNYDTFEYLEEDIQVYENRN